MELILNGMWNMVLKILSALYSMSFPVNLIHRNIAFFFLENNFISSAPNEVLIT